MRYGLLLALLMGTSGCALFDTEVVEEMLYPSCTAPLPYAAPAYSHAIGRPATAEPPALQTGEPPR